MAIDVVASRITRVLGWHFMILAEVSTPLRMGRFSSMTTRSGFSLRASLAAVLPSAASPTTVSPFCDSKVRSPMRITGHSAAIRTFRTGLLGAVGASEVLVSGGVAPSPKPNAEGGFRAARERAMRMI